MNSSPSAPSLTAPSPAHSATSLAASPSLARPNWVIRSFVRHQGRLTAGQQRALSEDWPQFGLDYQAQYLAPELFSAYQQVVFEIGFGNGESLIDMAQHTPNTLFIGCEVHRPGVGHALMQASAKKLSNLRVIIHDAVEVIDHMLPAHCLDRIQIYFPDPWHKKRHHKRRLISAEFCQKIARALKPDGLLHVATDWPDYAEHTLAVLSAQHDFNNTSTRSNGQVNRPDFRPMTKFERRGERLGHPIADFMFTYQPDSYQPKP